MLYLVLLFIAGVLKVFSGVDLVSFIFLYSLILDDKFNYNDFLICALIAEVFNIYSLGLYVVPYFVLYLLRRWQLKVFHGSRVSNFLFLFLGFIFIRTFCNFHFLIEYKAGVNIYFLNLMYNSILIIGIYFAQLYLEKCFPKYTKYF